METEGSTRRSRKHATDLIMDYMNLVHIAPRFYEIHLNNIVPWVPGWRSLFSDSLRTGRSGVRTPVGAKYFLFSIQALGPKEFLLQWVKGLGGGA